MVGNDPERRMEGVEAAPPRAAGVPLGDLVFAAALVAVAVVVWVGTASLPPPRYEPIGSAALPRAIAMIMALLAVIMAVGAVRRGHPAPGEQSSRAPGAGAARTIALAGLVLLFVAVMDQRLLGFRPTAAVFVTAATLLLGAFTLRRLVIAALFGGALSVTLHAVFTRLFYIDLP